MMLITTPSSFIIPKWPAAKNIRAVVTTRQFGNLATHVEDEPALVKKNRERLRQDLLLPAEPVWLEQTHGVNIVNLDTANPDNAGDGAYTQSAQSICVILTADCLPIFLASREGHEVAAVHAGWKGLLAGIIDASILPFKTAAPDLLAWLGPAIGPDHFEVGVEVRDQFIARHIDYAAGFQRGLNGNWYADLYQLAKINFRHCGVTAVYGGDFCTYCDAQRFYSYRREKSQAGRMASLIWRSQ